MQPFNLLFQALLVIAMATKTLSTPLPNHHANTNVENSGIKKRHVIWWDWEEYDHHEGDGHHGHHDHEGEDFHHWWEW